MTEFREQDLAGARIEVLTVRRERQAMVRRVMASLTDEQLAADVTRTEPGWPRTEHFPSRNASTSSSSRNGNTGSVRNGT